MSSPDDGLVTGEDLRLNQLDRFVRSNLGNGLDALTPSHRCAASRIAGTAATRLDTG
jgi:hypothetical protein